MNYYNEKKIGSPIWLHFITYNMKYSYAKSVSNMKMFQTSSNQPLTILKIYETCIHIHSYIDSPQLEKLSMLLNYILFQM